MPLTKLARHLGRRLPQPQMLHPCPGFQRCIGPRLTTVAMRPGMPVPHHPAAHVLPLHRNACQQASVVVMPTRRDLHPAPRHLLCQPVTRHHAVGLADFRGIHAIEADLARLAATRSLHPKSVAIGHMRHSSSPRLRPLSGVSRAAHAAAGQRHPDQPRFPSVHPLSSDTIPRIDHSVKTTQRRAIRPIFPLFSRANLLDFSEFITVAALRDITQPQPD